MPRSPEKRPFFLRVQFALAQARFFTFSALFHFILVLAGGSVVLFRHDPPAPDFTGGDTFLASEVAVAPPADPTPELPANESPEAAQMPAAKVSAAITSTALNASATTLRTGTPNLAVAKLDGGGAGAALAAKIGAPGTLRSGGMAGFFGRKEKAVNALVGTFYDTKQTRSKKPTALDVNGYAATMSKFVNEGWRKSVLADFFRAPQPLYSTQLFIPDMLAEEGPRAFEMEKEVQPSRWLIHYQGRVAPPFDGVCRFVGAGDDYLVVRFNGKVVLDHGFSQATDWQAERYYDYGWTGVPKGFARGDKFRVKGGQFYDLEILIGEQPGGKVFFCLMLEEDGVSYQQDARGNPILPIFRLADGAVPELAPGQTLPPYQADGPIWKAASLKSNTSGFEDFFGPK